MYKEDNFSFDVLCPIMPDDVQFTKKDLINELNLYQSTDKSVSDEKNNFKRKAGTGIFNHTIYMLPALLECVLVKKTGFRFVVTMANQIFFSKEGPAGYDRPTHYQLAQITSETKDFPTGYFDSQGHLALSMGRIYLNQLNQLTGIDWNSGGFHPKAKATIRGLAIILLCFPSTLFASKINFDVLDNNGGYVDTHPFTVEELKTIVLPKFSVEEKGLMIEANSFNRVIHLKGTQASVSSDSDVEDNVENHPPLNQDDFSELEYDSPVENDYSRSIVNTPKTVKTSARMQALSFSSPMKKKDVEKSPKSARYSPYRGQIFSTSNDPGTNLLSSPQSKQYSPPPVSRAGKSKNRQLSFR